MNQRELVNRPRPLHPSLEGVPDCRRGNAVVELRIDGRMEDIEWGEASF
jgi:hypothetical protein